MATKNASSEPKKTESRTLLVLLWIGLPSLLVGLLALGLGFWPMPTRVQIDLQARSLEFTAAKDHSLSPDVGFRSLEVDGFQHAVFPRNDCGFREAKVSNPSRNRPSNFSAAPFPVPSWWSKRPPA